MNPIDKQKYSRVEGILYNYKTLNSQIKALEDELEVTRPLCSGGGIILNEPKGSGGGDSPQEKWLANPNTERLYKKLIKLRRQKATVEDALCYLTDREKRIFDLKYQQELQHKQVAEGVGVTVRWYRQLRDRLLRKVAGFVITD